MEEREVIILGSGVAGLSAAIYNARAELKPLVLTGMADGGQIATTTDVENFPSYPEGIKGPELVARMKQQAEKFGAEVRFERCAEFKTLDNGTYLIKTDSNEYSTHAVIIATGASARWLGLPEEDKYKSRGVHTCATCDGAFYKNKEIIVVGGGDAAAEEATFLTKFASKVHLFVRGTDFRASVPMQERVKTNNNIEVHFNTEIESYKGDEKGLNGVVVKNTETGETKDWNIDGVFLAIGHIPNTDAFKDHLELDKIGYIIANPDTSTKLPGVFAAGDVADHVFRQAITAAGTGAAAAIMAERYVSHK